MRETRMDGLGEGKQVGLFKKGYIKIHNMVYKKDTAQQNNGPKVTLNSFVRRAIHLSVQLIACPFLGNWPSLWQPARHLAFMEPDQLRLIKPHLRLRGPGIEPGAIVL